MNQTDQSGVPTGRLQWMEGGNVRRDGFAVRTGFNFAVYSEGPFVVTFAVKRGFRDARHLIVIPEDAFRRFDGTSSENSELEQERMRRNFVASMDFAGCLVQ